MLELYICIATNSSDKEKGVSIYWSWDVSSLSLKEIGFRIHPQARF